MPLKTLPLRKPSPANMSPMAPLTFGRGFQPIALSTRQPELK